MRCWLRGIVAFVLQMNLSIEHVWLAYDQPLNLFVTVPKQGVEKFDTMFLVSFVFGAFPQFVTSVNKGVFSSVQHSRVQSFICFTFLFQVKTSWQRTFNSWTSLTTTTKLMELFCLHRKKVFTIEVHRKSGMSMDILFVFLTKTVPARRILFAGTAARLRFAESCRVFSPSASTVGCIKQNFVLEI